MTDITGFVVDFEPGLWGPFSTREAADRWAESHIRTAMGGTGSWVVCPVGAP